MTSLVPGRKKNVRNVPESNKMMNEYSAISPSMNDQWSGKTLFMLRLRYPASPNRLSTSPSAFFRTFGAGFGATGDAASAGFGGGSPLRGFVVLMSARRSSVRRAGRTRQ